MKLFNINDECPPHLFRGFKNFLLDICDFHMETFKHTNLLNQDDYKFIKHDNKLGVTFSSERKKHIFTNWWNKYSFYYRKSGYNVKYHKFMNLNLYKLKSKTGTIVNSYINNPRWAWITGNCQYPVYKLDTYVFFDNTDDAALYILTFNP